MNRGGPNTASNALSVSSLHADLRSAADLTGLSELGNRYSIEYKGRDVTADRALECAYGKLQRPYRIADISNGEVTEVCVILPLPLQLLTVKSEFSRFTMVNKADGVKNPRRSELKSKHEAIVSLRDRVMTEVSFSQSFSDLSGRGQQAG